VIEGFISTADNESFDNQKDKTVEDRLIVKCNSDAFAFTREISKDIEMSAVGNEEWNIQKVTLPITYIWTLPDLGKDHVRIYEITKVIKTSIHRSDVESRIKNAHENYSTKYK